MHGEGYVPEKVINKEAHTHMREATTLVVTFHQWVWTNARSFIRNIRRVAGEGAGVARDADVSGVRWERTLLPVILVVDLFVLI